jgi:hypothetical protein
MPWKVIESAPIRMTPVHWRLTAIGVGLPSSRTTRT